MQLLSTARATDRVHLQHASAQHGARSLPTGINILHIEPTVEKLLELAVLLRSTSAG